MMQDVRWKQRFQNFERALNYLQQAMLIENPDIFQKAGMVQFFEMSFELSWNVMKDYLEAQGFNDVSSPRSAIKKAFETGLLSNGHDWLDLLIDRNLTTHTYDEAKTNALDKLIRNKCFPLLKDLYETLKQK